jgi:formylglycine-generating enzyme required for sulfatase activity
MLAGLLATPVMKSFPADQLEGDCERATHVVSRLYLGGFAMAAGESDSIAATASLFGVGTDLGQDRTAERLASEGNAKACQKAQEESTREAGCSVPLRIGLTPIAGRVAESCPPGSMWSGTECVARQVVTQVGCPAGMAAIPGGSFTMGERGDAVSVKPFCMDVTEVTVAAYRACTTGGACRADNVNTAYIVGGERHTGGCNWGVSRRDQHPMNCVDWGQAATYCRAQGKRLPTEEEWEWAARGGAEGRSYPWGNAEPDFQACWSGVSKKIGTCPVGSHPDGKSAHGLHDMAGNVWEWTSSLDESGDAARVFRGSSWNNADPARLRASFRIRVAPSIRYDFLGFRCARSSVAPATPPPASARGGVAGAAG